MNRTLSDGSCRPANVHGPPAQARPSALPVASQSRLSPQLLTCGGVDERWLADLDRIEHSAEQLRTPARFDGERYTLREHIGLVRRTVLAEAGAMAAVVAAEGKSVPA